MNRLTQVCKMHLTRIHVSGHFQGKVIRLAEDIVQHSHLLIHRRRALSGNETAEWLNFIVNRWWVFSSQSLFDCVKRKVDYDLAQRKPSYLGRLCRKIFQVTYFDFIRFDVNLTEREYKKLAGQGLPRVTRVQDALKSWACRRPMVSCMGFR